MPTRAEERRLQHARAAKGHSQTRPLTMTLGAAEAWESTTRDDALQKRELRNTPLRRDGGDETLDAPHPSR